MVAVDESLVISISSFQGLLHLLVYTLNPAANVSLLINSLKTQRSMCPRLRSLQLRWEDDINPDDVV